MCPMDTDNMPETQQPQPGPSPTPSPKPAAAIEIGDIDTTGVGTEGGAMITPAGQNWIPPFYVSQDYLDTCQPVVGGFFVVFEEVACFMSNQDYTERYE